MPSLRFNPLTPRAFLLGMLGALAASLLVIVAMAILGEYTKTRGRLLLTFLVLASFCLSAIPPSALLRRRRLLPVAWTGLVASVAGFVLVAVGIWAARTRKVSSRRPSSRTAPSGCCRTLPRERFWNLSMGWTDWTRSAS